MKIGPGGGTGGGDGEPTSDTTLEGVIDSLIRVEDGNPRLRLAATVSTVVGTILWAFWAGMITAINEARRGVFGTLSDLESYLAGQGGVVDLLVAIPGDAFDFAFAQAAAWVGDRGLFAQVLAVALVAALVYLLVWTLVTGAKLLFGGS